jgi:CRISPR-associated protein Cmr1
MRKVPRPPSEEERRIEPAKDENLIVQVREYELITPLFGGGVEPGQCDDLTPIRGTEIRGHLRFWWRATRGGRYGDDLDLMRRDECLIWGGASTAGDPRPAQVQIAIKKRASGQTKTYRELDPELQYAGFPLQEGNKSVLIGVKFALKISFPSEIESLDDEGNKKVFDNVLSEVEAALWAWETFGGLGARTRRGFGALHCTHVGQKPCSFADDTTMPVAVQNSIRAGLRTHLIEGDWPKDVPYLSADIFYYRVTPLKRNANDAWKGVIGALKRFRQHRPGYGRSRWPEPDAIRKATGQWLKPGIKATSHPGHVPDPKNSSKFPRAAFGLPVVFHFKDADERNPNNPNKDPRDVLLKLASHDRMASPLILRPIRIAEGRYVGVAILLNGTLQPEDFYSDDIDLVLTEKDGRKKIVSQLKADLSRDEAKSIKRVDSGSPLFGQESDPLIAFLNEIQKETIKDER